MKQLFSLFIFTRLWPQRAEKKKLTGEDFHVKEGGALEPHLSIK